MVLLTLNLNISSAFLIYCYVVKGISQMVSIKIDKYILQRDDMTVMGRTLETFCRQCGPDDMELPTSKGGNSKKAHLRKGLPGIGLLRKDLPRYGLPSETGLQDEYILIKFNVN